MGAGNRVVSLTVSMVVLAGVLSAGAAFFHTQNLISSYDEAFKTELEQKGLAYASTTGAFLDALGPDAFASLQTVFGSLSEDSALVDAPSGARAQYPNELQSFEAWLPDSSAPGGYRLLGSQDFIDGGVSPRSEEVLLRLLEQTNASQAATAAIDEEAQLILAALPLALDEQTPALAVGTLSAKEEFEFFAQQRQEAIRNGVLLSVVSIVFVSLVGGGMSFFVSRDLTNRKRAEEALQESEERFRKVFAEGPLGMAIVTPEYRFANVNKRLCQMVGYSDEELTALTFPDITHPADLDKDVQLAQQVFNGEIPSYKMEKRYITKDKDTIWVGLHASVVRARDGRPLYGLAMIEDITERKRVEEALRESEERTRLIIDSASDAFISMDAAGLITAWNTQAETIFGWSRSEAVGRKLADTIIPPQHREAHQRGLEHFLKTGEGPVLNKRIEITACHRDGREFPVELAVWPVRSGGTYTFNAFVHDITERKRAGEALREQARRDPLTGVLNHGAIVEELRSLLGRGGDGVSHAVAMADVDGLKAINDTYGHQVGDAVLVAIARALSQDGALVGRYGGDEFVTLLPGADGAAAERYRDAVLDSLGSAGVTDPETGASVPVVASVGLATYPEQADTVAELIRLSDSAMYAAKRQRPVGAGEPSLARSEGGDRAAEMVGQIVPLLTCPGDLKEKLRLVAHRLSVGAGYDAVDFVLFAPAPGVPIIADTFAQLPADLIQSWSAQQRSEGSEPHPLRVLLERTRRPVILDDPQNDERLWESQRTLLREAQLRSALVAPMLWQNQLVGTLAVASHREGAFAPRDAQFLSAVATEVTAIVRMATLVEELQSSSTRLAEAQEETVMLLAAAAEAHDQATGRHLQGVRAITEALAWGLGYSEGDARELGLAAVLHDIGKVRVPDSVLASTGGLADEEWELMKHHTTWGEKFLAGRATLELAGTIAHYHHERWDGTGYPDGLSGDAIPEVATIVAVADAFDAMTHDRPYRAARSIDEAVEEIVANSGKQFSPKVVAVLERLYERKALPLEPTPVSEREAAA